jgi:hypothetical protein
MKSATVVMTGQNGRDVRPPLISTPDRAGVRSSPFVESAPARPGLLKVALGVVLAVLLSAPVWLAPTYVTFKDFGITEVSRLLTSLFLIALLAERALEVFVGTWRSPGASQLQLMVRNAKETLARIEASPHPDEPALREARTRLEGAERDEERYRCTTKQVALWTGLALGLLLSAVGVRCLETLTASAPDALSATQTAGFRLVDGLLTGGVIAGGSEGIHRVVTIFDNFMSTAAKRAKAGR